MRCSHDDDMIWVEGAAWQGVPPSIAPISTPDDPFTVSGTVKQCVISPQPACTCGIHSLCSPARIAAWSCSRLQSYLKACIDAGPGPLPPPSSVQRLMLMCDDPMLVLEAHRSLPPPVQLCIVTSFDEDSATWMGFRRVLMQLVPQSTRFWTLRSVVDLLDSPDDTSSEAISSGCVGLVIDPQFGIAEGSCVAGGRWSGVCCSTADWCNAVWL